MVFPKWVTKVGALMATIGLGIEGLRAAIDFSSVSPWLSIVLIGLGTVATAGGQALGDDDNDGTPNVFDPDWRKRGHASTRMLLAVALLGLLSVAACGAGWGGPRPTPIPVVSQPAVSWRLTVYTTQGRVDSVAATAHCGDAAWRTATAVSTCEWQVTRNGTAIAMPAGFTARVVLQGEAGTSATFAAAARGRQPPGTTGPWSPAVQQALTLDWPPISAPTVTWVREGT